jgi:hypothetical protein
MSAAATTPTLFAYYTFHAQDRLAESAHVSGYPLVASATPPTFQTDCAWTGAHCAVFSSIGSQYFQLPTVNLGALSADTGFSICAWFVFDDNTAWGRIFDFGNGPSNNNIILTRREGLSSLLVEHWCGAQSNYIPMSIPIVNGQWRHICVVNQGTYWMFYQSGVLTNSYQSPCPVSNVNLTSNYIGKNNFGADYQTLSGKVDEFKFFKGALSAVEAADVFVSRGPSLVNQ